MFVVKFPSCYNFVEPIYQVVQELKDTTDLDVSPEQEAPDQMYSILEEQPSATSSSGDVSEVYYATVLPEESENNKPLDPPVYADLTQQRNENEYQGLVTRKM